MLVELSVMEQRYQAVLAVVQDGWRVVEVARRLGVSRQSVHNWIARYEQGGLASLADRLHRPRSCNETGGMGSLEQLHEMTPARDEDSPVPRSPAPVVGQAKANRDVALVAGRGGTLRFCAQDEVRLDAVVLERRIGEPRGRGGRVESEDADAEERHVHRCDRSGRSGRISTRAPWPGASCFLQVTAAFAADLGAGV